MCYNAAVQLIVALLLSLFVSPQSIACSRYFSAGTEQSTHFDLLHAWRNELERALGTVRLETEIADDLVDSILYSRVGRRARNAGRSINADSLDARTLELLEQAKPQVAVSMETARAILNAIAEHPVGGDKKLLYYDPTLNVRFCFGRAMIGHIEALIRGVPQESMYKIWLAGDLRLQENFRKRWSHHVALLIYTVEGWRVLDPIASFPLRPDIWIADWRFLVAKHERTDSIVVLSDPNRFMIDTPTYNRALFNSTVFEELFPGLRWREYFRDLAGYYGLDKPDPLFSIPGIAPSNFRHLGQGL